MRSAAAVLLVALSAACVDPDVPKYEVSPVTPTLQVPTTLTIAAVPGIGSSAKNAFVTATLKDQERHGIGSVMLSFALSKGTIEPAQGLTSVNGEVRATVTSGTATTLTVSGAGLQASIDVAIDAPLSVSLSVPPPEKNVPVKITATLVSPDAVAPLSFAWDFGDGQTAKTDSGQVTHQYRDDVRVTISVTVTDALGRTGSTSTSVTVRDNPELPELPGPTGPSISVQLTAAPNPVVAGQSTTLTAVATSSNGAPTVTSFDFDCADDGTIDATQPGNTFVCQYAATGTKTARATAHGGTITGAGTVSITVVADVPLFMSVVLSSTPPILQNAVISFTGTVTSTGPVPLGLTWYWDWDGDGTPDEVFNGLNSPQTLAHIFYTAGNKTVKVRATHAASGREALGSVAITVSPSP